MGTVVGAVGFTVLLLLSIFFHELGHYATAKWSGIKVRQFFVGFGPTLWSFRRGRPEVIETDDGELVERPETEYGVKALPLGGFVKIAGMSTFEDVAPEDQPRSFPAAPAWKRAVVLSAGSITHFITAFVILWVIFAAIGLPGDATLTVDDVAPSLDGGRSPAAEAGLRSGDRIVAVDGRAVSDWDAFRDHVRAHPGEAVSVTVLRDGNREQLTLTPEPVTQEGERIGMIGVAPALETVRVGPIQAVTRSSRAIADMTVTFFRAAPDAFSPSNIFPSGDVPADERPISIYGAGRIAADLFSRGQIVLFLSFFVSINIFIGIFNMLPLPPLDGGHLLVLAIERIRGKEIDQRKLLPVMAVVMSLLIILAVALLFQDIINPIQSPFQ